MPDVRTSLSSRGLWLGIFYIIKVFLNNTMLTQSWTLFSIIEAQRLNPYVQDVYRMVTTGNKYPTSTS